MRNILTAIAAAATVILPSGPAAAQDAGTGALTLELNRAATVETGCRLTYVATNGTGSDLEAASYEVAVFDGAGVVDRLLILEFGDLADGRTKVMQFDMTEAACEDVSRVLINTVSECRAVDGTQADCLARLETTTRTDIAFGL